MTLQWTEKFKKDYQNLHPRIQKQTDKCLKLLLHDWRHKSLRTKKMKGQKGNVFEVRVTKGYRLTFIIQGDTYILLRVGTHKEITGR